MNAEELNKIANAMVAPGRGILAMDESHPTCNGRFEKLGIATTEEMRQAYRDMLVTAPGLSDYISGAILFDETIRQKDERISSLAEQAKGAPRISKDTEYRFTSVMRSRFVLSLEGQLNDKKKVFEISYLASCVSCQLFSEELSKILDSYSVWETDSKYSP